MTLQSAAARISARIAAGAEGGVDVDAAVADIEQLDGAAGEHGNVTGRSASDSRFCCRGPPSFPCSVRIVRRHPGAQLLLQRADLLGGLREFRAKASGLPDLKLVAEPGKGDFVADAGMSSSTASVRMTRPSPSIFRTSLVP